MVRWRLAVLWSFTASFWVGSRGEARRTPSELALFSSEGAESHDHFGFALAGGDFDRDGWADLAIGVPDENVGDIGNAGVANVVYSDGTDLSSSNTVCMAQEYSGSNGVPSTAEVNHEFGLALAVGNFNGAANGSDDLAIGIPGQIISWSAATRTPPVRTNAGVVIVLYSQGVSGLQALGGDLISPPVLATGTGAR